MSSKLVCIHGHFYQPPRENPFTGLVDEQSSAAPFANWNERITAESYAPNLAARVLGEDGGEEKVINNYSWISFDFGPTLLSWLQLNSPDVYTGVVASDQESMAHFGGHGSAMAQSYNHTILPLSNARDKRTQITWGIADFWHRYGRKPKGMWLPETAVDTDTLDLLAQAGIEFTVLAPYQAAAVEGENGEMIKLGHGEVDPRLPYAVELAAGRSIAVFFYDGPLSQEIAFNGLLEDGHLLARRLVEAAGDGGPGPALGHVATDGETYGHHHRFGEMALASAIEAIHATPEVELTNYGEFLANHPPQRRAQIVAESSWSCAHGVERWRSDCGCSTGGEPTWNQKWRGPLRIALDWLRDEAISEFVAATGRLFSDPWDARDAYIEVVLGGDPQEFIREHGQPGMSSTDRHEALALLEIQHRSMLMYTSCGWFFNDVTGLETIFVLRHAGRLINMMRAAVRRDLEPGFLQLLDGVRSNHPGVTGREVYMDSVAPFMT